MAKESLIETSLPIRDFHLSDHEGRVFPIYQDISSLPVGEDSGKGLVLILNQKEYKVNENNPAFHLKGNTYHMDLSSLLRLSPKTNEPIFISYLVRDGKKENLYSLVYIKDYKMLSDKTESGEHIDLVFGPLFFSGPYIPSESGSNLRFRIQNKEYDLIRD